MKRKMSIKIALFGHKIPAQDLKAVQRIYETVESRPERYELNLYVTGYDEDDEPGRGGRGREAQSDDPAGAPARRPRTPASTEGSATA